LGGYFWHSDQKVVVVFGNADHILFGKDKGVIANWTSIHPEMSKIFGWQKVCLEFLFIAKDFVLARSKKFYVGGSSTLVL